LEVDEIGLFKALEEGRFAVASLHGAGYDRLGQGLAAARLADYEERYAKLDAHDHHEDVLEQGRVARDIYLELLRILK